MRKDQLSLETVGPVNLSECGIGCLANPKNPGYQRKVAWLRQTFDEGVRLLMLRDGEGRALGFLEYVPGEFAWRPVRAAGWLFVHCLWVYPRGQKIKGLGSRLLQACVEEARRQQATGVAALVSDGPFMAGKEVFLKNGFQVIDKRDRFQLLIYRLGRGPEPRFREIQDNVPVFPGLHLIYCAQCPMLPKSVADVSEMAAAHGLNCKVTVLKNAREAQNAPSYYGVFSLLWNGRLLSDHYVSTGRFKNLLTQEILSLRGPNETAAEAYQRLLTKENLRKEK
jgi:GNAT superfamily N-acetyltransferase